MFVYISDPSLIWANQCDQIGRLFNIWAIFKVLGGLFRKRSPKLSKTLGNFLKSTTFCQSSNYDLNIGYYFLVTLVKMYNKCACYLVKDNTLFNFHHQVSTGFLSRQHIAIFAIILWTVASCNVFHYNTNPCAFVLIEPLLGNAYEGFWCRFRECAKFIFIETESAHSTKTTKWDKEMFGLLCQTTLVVLKT